VYIDFFWEGVEEFCIVSKPLVKVFLLVDEDKLAIGYSYEAMDRAKKATWSYYLGKDTLKHENIGIYGVLLMIDGLRCSIAPFMQLHLSSTLHFFYLLS
jgi:hypothetical protein